MITHGFAGVTLTGVAETVHAEEIFYIDPGLSTLAIRSADQSWDSTPLHGALFGLGSPARFLMGAAFGGHITVDGGELRNTWAILRGPVLVDLGMGTFDIDDSEISELSWFGTYVSNDVKTGYILDPTDDASGTYDIGNEEWTLTFEQDLAGGRRVEIELAGYLQSGL